jgi:hypothetical protein
MRQSMLNDAVQKAKRGSELLRQIAGYESLSLTGRRAHEAVDAAAAFPDSDGGAREAVELLQTVRVSIEVAKTHSQPEQVERSLAAIVSSPPHLWTPQRRRAVAALLYDLPDQLRFPAYIHGRLRGDLLLTASHGHEAPAEAKEFVEASFRDLRTQIDEARSGRNRQLVDGALARDPVLANPLELRALWREMAAGTVTSVPDAWQPMFGKLQSASIHSLTDEGLAHLTAASLDEASARGHLARIAAADSPSRYEKLQWLYATRSHPKLLLNDDALLTLELHIGFYPQVQTSLKATRAQLEVVRDEARVFASEDTRISQVAADVVANAERNIQRIDGKGSGGYENFPDYGELGQLISDMKLLRSLAAPDKPKRSVTW